jgi:hypothetical protein
MSTSRIELLKIIIKTMTDGLKHVTHTGNSQKPACIYCSSQYTPRDTSEIRRHLEKCLDPKGTLQQFLDMVKRDNTVPTTTAAIAASTTETGKSYLQKTVDTVQDLLPYRNQ